MIVVKWKIDKNYWKNIVITFALSKLRIYR